MRVAYGQALHDARLDVAQLGTLAFEAIAAAMSALEHRDAELAARVIEDDDEIDDLRRQVERTCLTLVWKEQPVASDLRAIIAMLHIVRDLERIGDYAVDISHHAVKLIDVAPQRANDDIWRIAALAQEMLGDAVTAYRTNDRGLAESVAARDDDVDDLYHECTSTVQREMQHDPTAVAAGVIMLFVLASIERVGDRAQKIALNTRDILNG